MSMFIERIFRGFPSGCYFFFCILKFGDSTFREIGVILRSSTEGKVNFQEFYYLQNIFTNNNLLIMENVNSLESTHVY